VGKVKLSLILHGDFALLRMQMEIPDATDYNAISLHSTQLNRVKSMACNSTTYINSQKQEKKTPQIALLSVL